MMARLRDWLQLVRLSSRLVAGRRFWIPVLLPLLWPAFQAISLALGWREDRFEAADAQTALMGLPVVVLAIGLGVRIIAGEMDRRTLEIAYTIPGGSQRAWLTKLAAATLVLLAALALLALVVFVFFTSYPPAALYGAMQSALFYLVLAMAFAALSRSEVTGAMVTAVVLTLNGLFTGFGGVQRRLSPFFNPLAVGDLSPSDLFAFTLQNRIGFVLAIAAVIALAFARAERREKLLGG